MRNLSKRDRTERCPRGEGLLRRHSWEWRSGWNGNNRAVLPFETSPHGIARAGHRCYHCGAMRWDDDDFTFAVRHARGFVDVLALITEHLRQKREQEAA